MKRDRKAYIIPGYGQSTRCKEYRKLADIATKFGYEAVKVNPDWSKGSFEHWTNTFLEAVDDRTSKKSIVIGFSFGAIIALQASQKIALNKVFLCSLSPYFSKDLVDLPKSVSRAFGKRFMSSLKDNHYPDSSTTSAFFIFGENDWPVAIEKARSIFSRYAGKKKFCLVKDADHSLTDEYLLHIERLLKLGGKNPGNARLLLS
ncbi:MAG: hypothetical protein Q8L64_04680 [bacterium]|nr:hypothetical protein [bacterium]